ncbi:aminoacyl-tRNA hydrolase [Isoptericola sp. 4D.3]|uniref:Aminoacyl-tRNA hydrolase n=1 Tax=Isoptericola peretonis TaxID=2918523 RepID=A0ABT0J2E5_9MICO|nr:aminoacyl-tRNA hydrolase [Isoptericola sp. 4D.3]
MPDDARGGLRVTSALLIPERELSWRFSRSSGPGGQGVNTADSRVELSWDVAASTVLTEAQRARILERLASRAVGGAVTVVASRHRAQLRNRDDARDRLAALVAEALAPPGPRRRATRPTRGSVERRIDGKKRRAAVKRSRRPPLD